MKWPCLFLTVALACFLSIGAANEAFAQNEKELETIFNRAGEHFIKGEYNKAVALYDKILEIAPNNVSTLKMKGVVQSNQKDHTGSLKQFFKVLQYKPDDVIALTGMGIGFGNLGEYQESIAYFEKASKEKPGSITINNYMKFINKIISKYPYTPTEKPQQVQTISIPEWTRSIAGWWVDNNINDREFAAAFGYLIDNKVIKVPTTQIQGHTDEKIFEQVKNNVGLWADKQIDNGTFMTEISHLIEIGLINISPQKNVQKSQKELDQEFYLFDYYLDDVSRNIKKETRYIQDPNPSQDVIKKFQRDYVKWNLEEKIKGASKNFPDPTREIIDGTHVISYKVFINDQPTGLPLDHVGTLKDSFLFWETENLSAGSQSAKIKFEVTNLKHEANVWVTWVVRNIGDGVLGHANIGKGVVEVTLGDYNCDGSFQLYDVSSVKAIMTHELGHSIGLQHSNDTNNIMYPALTPAYAYCLLR